MYGTPEAAAEFAQMMSNPSLVAMCGPVFALINGVEVTVATIFSTEMAAFMVLLMIFMNVFFINRYTRTDEENGNLELLEAKSIYRTTSLTAAMVVSTLVNILLGLVSAVGITLIAHLNDISGFTLEGSLCFGLTLTTAGVYAACLTAILAQLFSSARAVNMGASAVILVLYVVRAVGDLGQGDVKFFGRWTPIGSLLYSQPYAHNDFRMLVVVLAQSFILFLLAYIILGRRDLNSALFKGLRGRETASKWLTSECFGRSLNAGNPLRTLGLTARINRGVLLGGGALMLVLGASYGSVVGSIDQFISQNEMLRNVAVPEGHTTTEVFMQMLMLVMAVGAVIPPVVIMQGLWREENKARLEVVYVRNSTRSGFLGAHLLLASLTVFLMLLLVALGFWGSAFATVADSAPSFRAVVESVFIYFPANFLLVSLSAFGVSTAGRGLRAIFPLLAWMFLAFSFLVNYLGRMLQFDDWVFRLTPYGNIPQLLTDNLKEFSTWMPLCAVILASLLLLVFAFPSYRRRDLVK
jgi:ABC-2 type transport system permease protein